MAETYQVDLIEDQGVMEMTVSGQLTINNIVKITDAIKPRLMGISHLNISVKDVDNVDLTFMQLLYSIRNSGKKNGFGVDIHFSLPEDLSSLLKNAGFGSMIN